MVRSVGSGFHVRVRRAGDCSAAGAERHKGQGCGADAQDCPPLRPSTAPHPLQPIVRPQSHPRFYLAVALSRNVEEYVSTHLGITAMLAQRPKGSNSAARLLAERPRCRRGEHGSRAGHNLMHRAPCQLQRHVRLLGRELTPPRPAVAESVGSRSGRSHCRKDPRLLPHECRHRRPVPA